MKGIIQSTFLLVILLFVACTLNAQDGFRVYPYLQHPSSEAMSILWFSEVQQSGELLWWKQHSDQVFSVESDPQEAATLAYSIWEDTVFFGGEAPSFPYRHRVRLEDLDPGTIYEYKVTQGEESFSSSFQTAPAGNDSIRIIVYSDSETEPESTDNPTSWVDPVTGDSRLYLVDQTIGYRNNLEVIRSRHPDLVLIAGDLTQHGGEQRDWDEFWYHNTNPVAELSLAGKIPVIAVPGNHEYYEGTYLDGYNQPGSERAISRYLTYFETPENHSPVAEQEGRYYSLRYGPASFIMLDLCNNSPNGSQEDTNFYLLGENDPEGGNAPDFNLGSNQYIWLETQLLEAQKNSLFTFVIFHHSPYSSGPHGFPPGEDELYDNQSGVPVRALTPLFLKYGVDAVFSGHDEIWERSEIHGSEIDPEGNEIDHTIQFYDVGTGGDGLRGSVAGTDNPFQKFLVHTDVPEIWEEGILKEGGKHYGHLEVDIKPVNDSVWLAILDPVYVFPLFDGADSSYSDYERRVYDDRIILTRTFIDTTLSSVKLNNSSYQVRNYPNPFYEQTTIEYSLSRSCDISISIMDVLGRTVQEIREHYQGSGVEMVVWNGKDGGGNRVMPGTYYYLLKTSTGHQFSGRMMLLFSKSTFF